MTTKRLWIGAVVVLALAAIALPSLVTAQYRGGGNQGNPSAMMAPQGPGFGQGPAWIEKLELSDEQSEQLAALRLSFQQTQLRTRGKIAAAQADLDALLLDPEATRGAVQSAGKALEELRGQAQTQRLNHQMDVREILTAEQRTILVQMRARGVGGGGFGLHRGGRGGRCLERGDGWGGHRWSAMHPRHPMPPAGGNGPEPEDAPQNEGL